MQPIETIAQEIRDHPYRRLARPKNLTSFRVLIKETDLMVSASRDLSTQTRDLVHTYRRHLEDYIRSKPDFRSTLLPFPEDLFAPEIARRMISATRLFGVGPMAAVAGTIAECVGGDLLQFSHEVIVENGGDIFLRTTRPVTVSILAGGSPLSNKFGVIVHPHQMPAGICTSSATVGHSLSLGVADAVCIVAESPSTADAAATSLGNRITSRLTVKREIESIKECEIIKGGIVIIDNTMATWGDIELTKISNIR